MQVNFKHLRPPQTPYKRHILIRIVVKLEISHNPVKFRRTVFLKSSHLFPLYFRHIIPNTAVPSLSLTGTKQWNLYVRLCVIWNKQGELISFNWNTIWKRPPPPLSLIPDIQGVYLMVPISVAAVTECTSAVLKGAKQEEKLHKYFHKKYQNSGALFPCKIRFTRGKLRCQISAVEQLTF